MNNTQILIFLLEHKEEKYSINQIAKALKLNYRVAHTQVKLLEKENLIKTERVGRSLLCSLAYHFNEKLFAAEFKRREKLLMNKDFSLILKRFERAKQNFILLLFGSYAKKTQTRHSDIDLLAITENKKEIENIAELIPRDIHLTCVTYLQFLKMKKSKEDTVGSEAMKNNVILIGIEDYYRLLQND
jgi:predicted nucleotidyltransferase